ncbi:MAG: hypothetical protein LRY54_01835 [Alphaproteobacteria bacterium]|nr:hypothetical protein [Alphaproteobacteria bacterium]
MLNTNSSYEPGDSNPQQTLALLYTKYAEGGEAALSDNMTANLYNIANGLKKIWSQCEHGLTEYARLKQMAKERVKIMERHPNAPAAVFDSYRDAENSYNSLRVQKALLKADIKAFAKACKAPEVEAEAAYVLASHPFLIYPDAPAPVVR